MLFWLLVLVVLASLAGIGYRQGVVRVAFALVGILFGALLAVPLGRLVKPLLIALGLNNPVLAWALAPLVVFLIISNLFKIPGFMVHQKVDVHFKYHAGDLRLALWERLNRRLGLCLALVNGALYIILISFVIYTFGYWTVQVASADKDPRLMRLLNRLAQDLENTGFERVAMSVSRMPQVWYDAADLTGLLYNNPLTEARLARYPAFLGLAERQEFQDMANDSQFTELLLRPAPIMEVLDQPRAQAITQNPDMLKLVWTTVVPDLKDLPTYLATGKSPKYGQQKILGRWNFNLSLTMNMLRRAKPNITSKEMQGWKTWAAAAFTKTSFVAFTDQQAILKNLPAARPTAPGVAPTAAGPQTLKGKWTEALEGKYQLALSGGARDMSLTAKTDGDRLTMVGVQGMDLVFDRED
jgi:hypothetical protein